MNAARSLLVLMAVGALPFSAGADALDAQAGKALFKRQWVPAPASTDASDGLGPLFNARSCSACHQGGGGARVVTSSDGTQKVVGAVVRLGSPTGVDPYYGIQLQTNAVQNLTPEAEVSFLPKLSVKLLGPALAPETKMAVRVAPSLFGSAELDRASEIEIRSRADPDDTDHDGISGRVNEVGGGVGRFGWKAAQATLRGQIAHAFAIDIGLSSPQQPYPYGDCTALETECRKSPNGESPLTDKREVSNVMLDLVAQYLATLETPKQKPNPEGEVLFSKSGCASCHVPTLKGNDGALIPAFTDLLLHDMGPELDDGVAEPGVASSEWRTAPLKKSYPAGAERRYLHDGSAITVKDAIEKHGGEAQRSREAFRNLSDAGKAKLIEYVNGRE
jgi:CxxC motif-containing protein (DUF1111 family)